MKKIAIAFSAMAICGAAVMAYPSEANAAEYGTREKLVEVARNYYRLWYDNTTSEGYTNTSGNWCARFANHCVGKAGGIKESESESTTSLLLAYKKAGKYHARITNSWSYDTKSCDTLEKDTSYTPQVGDLVLIENWLAGLGDGPDHTGIVVGVKGTGIDATVETIEGNWGDNIVNEYRLDDVWGYCTIEYPNSSSSSPSSPSTPSSGTTQKDSYSTGSKYSRIKAVEEARLRTDKAYRGTDYDKTTIGFVNEVLNAANAKSFYSYPSKKEIEDGTRVPHVTEFVADYEKNGAYFKKGSGYTPRIGDIAALETNGKSDDGADKLAIVSGVKGTGSSAEISIVMYDPGTDSVKDSFVCDVDIHGFCTPFYEYDDLGDFDMDGFVTYNDIAAIRNQVENIDSEPVKYKFLCADVNKNGSINRTDVSDLEKKLSKQRTFEAETDLSSTIRTADEIKKAGAISGSVNDSEGYLVYGPYVNALSEGDKMASFRMKIDNNTADDAVVARIEISDYTNDTILATREITRKEFMAADSYQDFYLNFNYPNTTDKIESRVYYKKKALITVDKIKIADEKTITNKTYEAETDLASLIRTKDSSGKYGKYGIEATVKDSPGVLAYGPYVDKLALGTYSVDYYLKVDNNNNDSNQVLRLDIFDSTKRQIIAEKTIKRTDFKEANKTQVFTLNFNNISNNDIYEFRVHYLGYTETILDKVVLRHLDTETFEAFEAENKVMGKKGGTAADGGYSISADGEIIYGPYTTKTSLGDNKATFKAKISGTGNADDVVAVIDIHDADQGKLIAQKEIKRKDFSGNNYTNLSLNFTMNENMIGHKIETRITAKGKGTITLDRTTIANNIDGSVKLNVKNNSSSGLDASQLNTTSRTVLMKGIDVSHPGQPEHIDWATVSKNVDFAIIRAGYGNSASQMDDTFIENYNGATQNGVSVGAYWYSYAESVEDAIAEAKACIQVLGNRLFQLPVYYDIEENVTLSKGADVCSAIARAFCDTIKEAGYTAGIYTSLSVLNSGTIDYSTQQAYALWVAQWSSSFDYKSPAGMWQYSETGSVAGISHAVDLDYCYVDYPSIL